MHIHLSPCVFFLLSTAASVAGKLTVGGCPSDICAYRGSVNSIICINVRYYRLPDILHCLNKNPYIREVALETVNFSCNCVWIKFLRVMHSRDIHVLPPRLTVACYNVPKDMCNHIMTRPRRRAERVKRSTPKIPRTSMAPLLAGPANLGEEIVFGEDEIRKQKDKKDEDEDETENQGKKKVVGTKHGKEDGDGTRGRILDEKDGRNSTEGEQDFEDKEDDTYKQSYNGSVKSHKHSNHTDVIIIGTTASSSRYMVLGFGVICTVISIGAVIGICVWMAYEGKRGPPSSDTSLLEVVLHPEKFSYSNACLRPKKAPYRLTPLPPDGSSMEVHWVQATVPLKRVPGGLTSHYP